MEINNRLKKALIPAHPLTNIEIMNYYKHEPRFNGVYSRDNLSNIIKQRAYVANLVGYEVTGTNWIALYVKNNEVTYFDSFGIEYVPKEIKNFIGYKKDININIFRIQTMIQLCVVIFVFFH